MVRYKKRYFVIQLDRESGKNYISVDMLSRILHLTLITFCIFLKSINKRTVIHSIDLVTQLRKIQESHPNVEGNLITDQNSFAKDSKKKRKKQKQCNKPQFKRALIDPNPLYIPDNVLTATLKELVGQIHGDFGRASVATGNAGFYSLFMELN